MTAVSTTGEWGTFSVGLPAELQTIRTGLNDLVSALNSVIEISLSALDLVKSFIPSYLDPVSVIVHLVIEELKKIAQDYYKIGLYITGDYKLLRPPFKDLQGGFINFEKRMTARITDRKDPTRPDLSSNTQVFSFFFYMSADVSEITSPVDFSSIVGLVQSLGRFWDIPSASTIGSIPVPEPKSILYGTAASDIFSFSISDLGQWSKEPPQKVSISWTLPDNDSGNSFKALPSLPPKGFIVTVSTLADGIPLHYDRAITPSEKQTGLNKKQVQPRESGVVMDYAPQPLILWGGAEAIDFPAALYGYNTALDSTGNVKDNRTRVFGVRDPAGNSVIPLELLKEDWGDGTYVYYFQRQFTVNADLSGAQWARNEYSFELNFADLPLHADTVVGSNGQVSLVSRGKASTYYVRIAAVSDSRLVEDAPVVKWQYDFNEGTNDKKTGSPFLVPLKGRLQPNTISAWSRKTTFTYLSANTSEYLKAVKNALLLLVLCRVDMRIIDEQGLTRSYEDILAAKGNKISLENVALIRTGLEMYSPLLDVLYTDFLAYIQSTTATPQAFKKDIIARIDRAVTQMFESTGAQPEVEKAVVDLTQNLRNTTWLQLFAGKAGLAGNKTISQTDRLIAEGLNANYTTALAKGKGEPGQSNYTLLGLFEQNFIPFTHSFLDNGIGVAPNIFSLGVTPEATKNILGTPAIIKRRKPHFIESTIGNPKDIPIEPSVPANAVEDFLAAQTAGMRVFYQKYINTDLDPETKLPTGQILMPSNSTEYLEELQRLTAVRGSGDFAPVFFWETGGALPLVTPQSQNPSENACVVFCRSLIAEYEDGVLLREAALTLGAASSAFLRPTKDGEWWARRFPQFTDVFTPLANWLDTVENSVRSVADTLISYIDFIEARIASLQQYILKINGLLLTMSSVALHIPKCAFLPLVSKGTDGLLADFTTALSKPTDSPLSYGAGVAVVIPLWPEIVGQLLFKEMLGSLFKFGPGKQSEGTVSAESSPLFGIEDLPASTTVPDPEPDVL